MISDTNHQHATNADAKSEGSLSGSSSSRAVQDQLAILKSLLKEQLDETREEITRSEELEREKEKDRFERNLQTEEMKSYLHGALDAQKAIGSINRDLAVSQKMEMERIEKLVEQSQETQKAEVRATFEGHVRHHRQKHGELMNDLRRND
ncbi:hypothetical protein GYMLUDRAFT_46429 [Collybiopsis luxurians FD-317 M1]|uniref:Unplaced genomic scaffold GYMLUscaffold_44, whole genome shotgun sequence n=1 Tax=Collybiopsis luxurians FD-317 M1 TaxID=944289 RepID=A0A0D0CPE8_9AGAR|nr:hypothetical protein GYMLUDRAFT_46429 [Collybiopsis luxurians FD-317 M1]